MTTFSKTPPTEPGSYYWIPNSSRKWKTKFVIKIPCGELCDEWGRNIAFIGGEWGGRVPALGTTWTVEQFVDYVESRKSKDFETKYPEAVGEYNEALTSLMEDVDDLEHGIAAVSARSADASTERNKKEAGK